ncbi:AAA family ATPase, partial [Mycobacterium intracellulare]|uniref:ATP-dependent nuclease n=1 Tax=Mycobacterium intracellulare TaxID=1767 RepID=UPI001CDA83E5
QWKQNKNLRLRVSIESKEVPTGNGNQRIDRYLQFRVEDTRHDFSNRLDRRSTGFRWFVSFIASFLEFEKEKSLILLFDEPGLSLHARAQMDLLDTIESKLAQGRQVLYSTHSPFMVRTNSLARTRIAEDQGPEIGSTITNDAGVVSDSDTLFPLQAALGYDIVQSLFIGNQNVLVEGVSDYIYLTMISQHLKAKSRKSLSDETRLLPAGGATNIPTFIALVGTQLEVVVLLDGNTSRQRIDDTIKRGRLDNSKVIDIARFSNVGDADIEDLFTPDEYIKLYNGTFGTKLKESDLNGTDRIVNRIARKRGDFNHGEVSAYFLRNLDKSLASLSEDTLTRFENVFDAINRALP